MIKRFGKIAAALVMASLPLAAGPAFASTPNGSHDGTLSVGASAVSYCDTLSPESITFGSYDPITYASKSLQDPTPAMFSTHCTSGAPVQWTVGIGGNCNKGATANERAMTDNASHYLSYKLYSDSFTTEWGTNSCGSPVAALQTGGGTGTANSIDIYGEIPAAQDVYTGAESTSYSDSVTVTVSY